MKIYNPKTLTPFSAFGLLFLLIFFATSNSALAAEKNRNKLGSATTPSPDEIIRKIQHLNLNEKQRKFIESLVSSENVTQKKR